MQYVAQTPQYEGAGGQAQQYGYGDPTGQQYQAQQYGQDPSAFQMYGGGGDYQMAGGAGMGMKPPKYNVTAVYAGESDREGMLHLQNTTKKALWQPRYVVIKENYMFLFKRSPLLLMRRRYPRPMSWLMNTLRKLKQEKLLKVISLEHAEIEIAESATMRPNTFVVHHKDTNAMGKWFFAYFLACDSRPEMEDWIKFLKEQKTSHLQKRLSQVDAIFSSQLHVVTKELYEAEKEKMKIAEELIETENDLFKAMKEEIECLRAEIEHARRIKPKLPPPKPPSRLVAAEKEEAPRPKVVPPPVPDEVGGGDEAFPIPYLDGLDADSPPPDEPEPEPEPARAPEEEEEELVLGAGVSNQIIVYEDEIDDDYIVGEVLITLEDTVEDLRERVEEELEMEDGFVMILNEHDLLSMTNSHRVYKYLGPENVLVLKY
ncbi:PH domain-containing protein [Chloropicon primus]|uniref:PH domain-containing protein n=1 Tax=Chloropicon primus TaxID=1764295 RepID=A0A5B8MGD3_9CHLO|nr:hypothetical protein A3770_03p22460 [Chloropicon primus]UPQ98939.1 PH domain-containing protein [Chloropicon primus]|eukprot:QDZ19728.1 hypothetical protein A3770_03p22460 [Chloropicon primus]